jgi:uncharacterized membrane protein YfcA
VLIPQPGRAGKVATKAPRHEGIPFSAEGDFVINLFFLVLRESQILGQTTQIMDIFVIAFSALAVLVAGIIRGYSGFGFSMIATTSMTLVLPPVEVIPVVLVLEILASAWLLPRVWKQIDWRSLSWLSAGVLIGTPPGVYLLAHVPAKPMRAGIALAIMVLVALLWRGFQLKKMPGKPGTVATGLFSGFLNGSAAIGGPPVILFYFSSPAGVTVSRASIIAYFLGTDSLAWAVSLAQGLVTLKTGILTGILCAPLLLGIFIGNRFFTHSKAGEFKRKVLILLMFLALAALLRTIYG